MRFEIRRLISDERVTRRMTSVESVASKRLDEGKNLLSDFFADTGFFAARDKFLALFFNEIENFLAHRFAQNVRFSEREPCKRLRDLHHLFLIHRHAVGVLQNRFEIGMQVFDFFGAVLARDKIGDPVHRSRTIECNHGDDVFEDGGFQKFEVAFHARGFQLKHAGCFSALQEFVGFFVVERERFDIDVDAVQLFDNAQGVLDDGEVFESQEVHFKQSDFFHVTGFGGRRILRTNAVFVLVSGHALHGRIFHDRIFGDHDPAGMHRSVATGAFEFFGIVDEAARVFVLVVESFEIGSVFECSVDGRKHGNEFGDLVAESVGESHGASDIAKRRARRHRSEGDNVRHVVPAVFFTAVAQHVVAAIVGEVHIDVGHRNALGIEKAFEKQTVFDGIDVGNTGKVRHERSGGGSASRSHDDAVSPRPVDKILHNEKVFRVAHFFDNGKFVFEPFAIALGDTLGEASGQTFFRKHAQFFHRRASFGKRVVWQADFSERDFKVAALGDFYGVVDGFGNVGKRRAHFFLAFDPQIKVRHGAPIVFIFFAVVFDADHEVLHGCVFGAKVVYVGGGNKRNAEFFGEIFQRPIHAFLFDNARMRLEFEEEILRAEKSTIFFCRFFGTLDIVVNNFLRNFSVKTSGKRDNAFCMFGKRFFVDAGFVPDKSVQLRLGDEAHEIFVSFRVGGEKSKIKRLRVMRGNVFNRNRRDKKFATDNDVHPAILCHHGKLYRTVQIGVFCDRNRVHAQFFDAIQNLVHLGGTFEKRIMGVGVKVDESHRG